MYVCDHEDRRHRGTRLIANTNQARSNPDLVDRPLRTEHTTMHHYNSTQYFSTETALLIFPFLQTNITSEMWPSGGKGGVFVKACIVLLDIYM